MRSKSQKSTPHPTISNDTAVLSDTNLLDVVAAPAERGRVAVEQPGVREKIIPVI